jgi:hypothetical protein
LDGRLEYPTTCVCGRCAHPSNEQPPALCHPATVAECRCLHRCAWRTGQQFGRNSWSPLRILRPLITATGSLLYLQVSMTISTRRFFCLPAGLSAPSEPVFGAAGRVLPNPCTFDELASRKSRSMSQSRTALGRRSGHDCTRPWRGRQCGLRELRGCSPAFWIMDPSTLERLFGLSIERRLVEFEECIGGNPTGIHRFQQVTGGGRNWQLQ